MGEEKNSSDGVWPAVKPKSSDGVWPAVKPKSSDGVWPTVKPKSSNGVGLFFFPLKIPKRLKIGRRSSLNFSVKPVMNTSENSNKPFFFLLRHWRKL